MEKKECAAKTLHIHFHNHLIGEWADHCTRTDMACPLFPWLYECTIKQVECMVGIATVQK